MKLLLAILLVGVLGMGALYMQTDGYTVLTTEAARRADIARYSRALPDAALLSSAGDPLLFRQALRSDGRLAIVNFMYTRCFSICLAMGSEFQIGSASLGERVCQYV